MYIYIWVSTCGNYQEWVYSKLHVISDMVSLLHCGSICVNYQEIVYWKLHVLLLKYIIRLAYRTSTFGGDYQEWVYTIHYIIGLVLLYHMLYSMSNWLYSVYTLYIMLVHVAIIIYGFIVNWMYPSYMISLV